MIAGGPGQGSIEAYGLKTQGSFFQQSFPGYNLVTFDDRGTGISSPLSCPFLEQRIATAGIVETANLDRDLRTRPRGLPALLRHRRPRERRRAGAARARPREDRRLRRLVRHEGVRGVRAWPTRRSIERDPPRLRRRPGGAGPLRARHPRRLPEALGRLCAQGRLQGPDDELRRDVAVLANRLEAKPVFFANVPDPTKPQLRGKPAPTIRLVIDGYRFMNLVVDADLLPAVRSSCRPPCEAALHGWYEPLKRLYVLDAGASAFGDIDVGLFVTTTCDDGDFPWSPLSPISTHQGAYEAAVAAAPARGHRGCSASGPREFGTAAIVHLVADAVGRPAAQAGAAARRAGARAERRPRHAHAHLGRHASWRRASSTRS